MARSTLVNQKSKFLSELTDIKSAQDPNDPNHREKKLPVKSRQMPHGMNVFPGIIFDSAYCLINGESNNPNCYCDAQVEYSPIFDVHAGMGH